MAGPGWQILDGRSWSGVSLQSSGRCASTSDKPFCDDSSHLKVRHLTQTTLAVLVRWGEEFGPRRRCGPLGVSNLSTFVQVTGGSWQVYFI